MGESGPGGTIADMMGAVRHRGDVADGRSARAREAIMKPHVGVLAAVLMLPSGLVLAQPQQPYAGLETRTIKALSDQQIADLRAGRGMSLALAAELNGFPGPAHVLELAEQLALSEQQRSKVQDLFAAM